MRALQLIGWQKQPEPGPGEVVIRIAGATAGGPDLVQQAQRWAWMRRPDTCVGLRRT